jgi:hypothetical protein
VDLLNLSSWGSLAAVYQFCQIMCLFPSISISQLILDAWNGDSAERKTMELILTLRIR